VHPWPLRPRNGQAARAGGTGRLYPLPYGEKSPHLYPLPYGEREW